jgi:thiazole synthase ThiGH ThiG subunit
MNDYDKKLTRVVSTKLSIEDDNFLQQLTTGANRYGIIKLTKSELVRAIITLSLSRVRQEMDKQSLPSQSQKKQGTSLNSPDT